MITGPLVTGLLTLSDTVHDKIVAGLALAEPVIAQRPVRVQLAVPSDVSGHFFALLGYGSTKPSARP